MKKDTLTIIVDMQNDFITGSLANKDAEDIVKKMAVFIKESEHDGKVVLFTLDTHDSDKYMNSNEGKHLPVPHCIDGTNGHKVRQELIDASEQKHCVCKPTFGMKQDKWIEVVNSLFDSSEDLKRIELVGTCTDICVVSNALILKSLYPDADIVVYEDLCAGLSKEKHEAALETMRSCQIEVTDYFIANRIF